MTTSVFIGTWTSTIYDITAQTSTVDGAVIASATTIGILSIEFIEYTTTQFFPVSSTSTTESASSHQVDSFLQSISQYSPSQSGSTAPTSTSAKPSESNTDVATSTSPQPVTSDISAGQHPNIIGETPGGLSTSAKAGIGAGAPIGVVTFVALFLLYLRWSKKRRMREHQYSEYSQNQYTVNFEREQEEPYHIAAQEAHQSEQQTHPAYENPNPRLSNPSRMSGTTFRSPQDDEPTYLGIPAHMSGDKRWSKEKEGHGFNFGL